jgi:hypothetical protein
MTKINIGEPYWTDIGLEIARKIEPEAIYVADLAVRFLKGDWWAQPVAVFYTPNQREGYTNNYFGLYKGPTLWRNREALFVCDATSVAEHEWVGLEYDGEVVFSRWVHDFRSHPKIDVAVDGGPDYTRYVGNFRACKEVRLVLRDGIFEVK